MATKDDQQSDELAAAARHRRDAERRISMNERLAALHHLCKQLSAIDALPSRQPLAGSDRLGDGTEPAS
jgi:hypothetical protein